jgi:hypothetical protein
MKETRSYEYLGRDVVSRETKSRSKDIKRVLSKCFAMNTTL